MSNVIETIQKANQSQSRNVKAFFEKGGEGSRGGKVIGHTKSGKPIYDTFKHPEHKNFTQQDHYDASSVHERIAIKMRRDKGSELSPDEQKVVNEHYKHADSHTRKSNLLHRKERQNGSK